MPPWRATDEHVTVKWPEVVHKIVVILNSFARLGGVTAFGRTVADGVRGAWQGYMWAGPK